MPSLFAVPVRIPSLCIHWDRDVICQLVTEDGTASASSACGDDDADVDGHPHWLSEKPGCVTVDGFINDIMSHLTEISDGVRDSVLQLQTPNQAGQVCIRLGHVEVHPFVQKRLAALPASARLAPVHSVSQLRGCNTPETGASLLASPPAPHRQAFR